MNASDKRNIILVDDHTVIRNALKELIEKLGPYQVIEQYDNGLDFVKALPFHNDPDLVVLDVAMPEMDGEETLSQLKQLGINTPVIILTLDEDDQKVIRLFRLGARGYLRKNCSAKDLGEALEQIFKTGYYHNDFLARSLRSDSTPRENPKDKIMNNLSAKEKEFLRHVCHEKEYTYDQIAGLMGVQHRTVDKYRENIFEKFDIKSKTGLVLFAIRNKLLEDL
jgi:two-component system invasion response regulator UvrY